MIRQKPSKTQQGVRYDPAIEHLPGLYLPISPSLELRFAIRNLGRERFASKIAKSVDEAVAYFEKISGIRLPAPPVVVFEDFDSPNSAFYWSGGYKNQPVINAGHVGEIALNILSRRAAVRPSTFHEFGHYIQHYLFGAIATSDIIHEGIADLFSASAVADALGVEEGRQEVVGKIAHWRSGIEYTTEHYTWLNSRLRGGTDDFPEVGDVRRGFIDLPFHYEGRFTEEHNLAARLVIMGFVGSRLSHQEYTKKLLTTPLPEIREELMTAIREDSDGEIVSQLARFRELVRNSA